MNRFVFGFLVVLATQSFCLAEVTKLPQEQRKVLEDSSRFREVHAITNLPPAVITLCADDHRRIADPGQKWEVTDVISDPSLPRKRLIWAAVAADYYVVHYERGGYSHSFHILVAACAKGDQKPKFVWRGICSIQLKDYAAFLNALQNGKINDKLDYAH